MKRSGEQRSCKIVKWELKSEIRNSKFETIRNSKSEGSGLGLDEWTPILFTDDAYERIAAFRGHDWVGFCVADVSVPRERLEARVV